MYDDFDLGPQSDEETDEQRSWRLAEEAEMAEEREWLRRDGGFDDEYDDSFADEMELGPEDDLGYEGDA